MGQKPADPWRYAGAGLELVGILLLLLGIGYWIDQKAGTEPTFTLVGAFIGIVGGLYRFIRNAMKAGR